MHLDPGHHSKKPCQHSEIHRSKVKSLSTNTGKTSGPISITKGLASGKGFRTSLFATDVPTFGRLEFKTTIIFKNCIFRKAVIEEVPCSKCEGDPLRICLSSPYYVSEFDFRVIGRAIFVYHAQDHFGADSSMGFLKGLLQASRDVRDLNDELGNLGFLEFSNHVYFKGESYPSDSIPSDILDVSDEMYLSRRVIVELDFEQYEPGAIAMDPILFDDSFGSEYVHGVEDNGLVSMVNGTPR